MKVLIVHAHPEPESFSSAMARTAFDTLTRQGHAVEVSDLYTMGFNPVASRADYASAPKNPDYLVYALEQRHAWDSGHLPADIAEEVRKVQACDLLLLNFPMFWFSVPAILKGWIDRVFLSGPFYGGRRIYDRGGMSGKRALVSLTLGGHEGMFGLDGIHGDLDGILKPLLQGSLGYAGFEVLEPFVGWHVPYIGDEARRDILQSWEHALGTLDERRVLPMPRMKNFDERLRPIKS